MNQHHRPPLAFHHKMKIRPVNVDKARFRARMIVGDASGDVALFESSGNFHN